MKSIDSIFNQNGLVSAALLAGTIKDKMLAQPQPVIACDLQDPTVQANFQNRKVI